MAASSTIQHVTSAGTSAPIRACVSLYSREAADDAPIYKESVRFRTSSTALRISPGDWMLYQDLEWAVKEARFHPSACRTVVDCVRVALDPSAVVSLQLFQLKPRYGQDADESPEYIRDVSAAIAHDAENVSFIHSGRHLIGTYRIFLDPSDAKDVNQLSALQGAETYKILAVHDLNLVGKMPYVIVQTTNSKYAA